MTTSVAKRELLSWFSAAVICKILDKKLYVLVHDVTSTMEEYKGKPAETKFPGGNNKVEDGTDFFLTMKRELGEELSISIHESCEKVISKGPIDRTGHQKFFYLIPSSMIVGSIRKGERFDGKSRLSEPYWVEVTQEFLTTVLFWRHRSALRAFIKYLGLSV